jgi:hypothetical protein
MKNRKTGDILPVPATLINVKVFGEDNPALSKI